MNALPGNFPRYLVVDFEEREMNGLLTEWRWLIGEESRMLLIAASGDIFLTDSIGNVFWLETGGGNFTRIASSVEDFETALGLKANQVEWLLAPVVEGLLGNGMLLAQGECYGYRILPALGGTYDGENRVPVSVREHIGFSGHVHHKIKDLPDGTQVELKWI